MPRSAASPSVLSKAIAATIRKIPRGKVSTYGAVAKAAGYPRCARHVAKVLQSVPDLPWQRVLGAGGRISLSGEAALALESAVPPSKVVLRKAFTTLPKTIPYVLESTRVRHKRDSVCNLWVR